jgi:NADH-quinone oxidoreductase subunit B
MAIDDKVSVNSWEKLGNFFRGRSPTMTSRFDMERLGMGPMATPRQADILLITGYLSVKTLRRVIYSYEQMQDPKYIVAFGSCTINGGIYFDSYATINKLDDYLPVDMYVAGCMPRPEAIMNAFNELQKKIRNNEVDGWKRYKRDYDQYKTNQLKAVGEVYVHDEFHE